MMSKPCPNTIQRVIKNLIPPKGVKRANNIEGSELSDGDGIEEKAAKSESEDESVPSENLLEKVLDENETATLFLPYQNKCMSTVSEARRSVKKRISKPRNLKNGNDEKS
ncbi:Hypothetical predicted protein [Octopus vulgaris]|uniref:Uncharacterized protein n=1 Tax=Octopus vulgaris TaxID=6645 RepID=A0AA36AUC1_OCTVU|nr:Hypothetical predicted protein [Octopus vulgaris]